MYGARLTCQREERLILQGLPRPEPTLWAIVCCSYGADAVPL